MTTPIDPPPSDDPYGTPRPVPPASGASGGASAYQPPPTAGEPPPAAQYGQQADYGQPQYPPPQYGQQAGYGTPAVRPGSGVAGTFSAGDAIGYAWRGFTRNIGPLVVLALIVLVVYVAMAFIGRAFDGAAARNLWSLLTQIVSLVLAAGVLRAALAIVDGIKPQVSMLFEGGGTVTYILASVVVGILSIAAGILTFFLLGLGALVIAFFVQYYGYAAVDDPAAGVFGSISRSFRLVGANFGQVLLLDLIIIALIILSVLTLTIGFLVTLPVIYIANAYAYRRMIGGRVVEPV